MRNRRQTIAMLAILALAAALVAGFGSTVGNAKTTTFLAHSAVPIRFTEEDLEQVAAGNFIVKVIYLPDPQFQPYD